MEAKHTKSGSYAWKSILKGGEVLKLGAKWRVGDGKSIKIWNDFWLPGKENVKVSNSTDEAHGEETFDLLIDQGLVDLESQKPNSDLIAELSSRPSCSTFQKQDCQGLVIASMSQQLPYLLVVTPYIDLQGLVGAPDLCEFLEIHTIYNQRYVSYVAREQNLNFHFDVKQPSPNFMACLQSRCRSIGQKILYGLTFFFSNFGPNTTTFIVPAELFPTRFRTTCHGISGAVGKVGAIIGSVGFLWASHDHKEEGYPKAIGMTASLVILGVVCIMGLLVTTFSTRETMGRSLEENENDN
uniref:Phosphate transporter n=1 Tax=Quercus lobata TaxID=97700 RepID=A0A7N2MUR5_QUELO